MFILLQTFGRDFTKRVEMVNCS